MPLLNYTSKIPAYQTAIEILSLLGQKGAFQVMTEFGAQGQPTALKWRIHSLRGPLAFALPVNVNAVFKVLTKQRVLLSNQKARMEQAERTAWRILKEWVQAQMALIETEMVDLEEVFLPYMLDGDRTMYELFSLRNMPALSEGTG